MIIRTVKSLKIINKQQNKKYVCDGKRRLEGVFFIGKHRSEGVFIIRLQIHTIQISSSNFPSLTGSMIHFEYEVEKFKVPSHKLFVLAVSRIKL